MSVSVGSLLLPRLAGADPVEAAVFTPTSQRPQIFLEDAGFDWKILGPDVHEFDYVAWQVCFVSRACLG
jgi:hypothetical protein